MKTVNGVSKLTGVSMPRSNGAFVGSGSVTGKEVAGLYYRTLLQLLTPNPK